jgi:hypothetical protein
MYNLHKALLLLGLVACAPQLSPQVSPTDLPTEPKLLESGTWSGRSVKTGGLEISLPSAALAVAGNKETLWVAYPFQLLVYRNGFLQETLPLPGVPTFIKSAPLPVVGFADRLYVPGLGTLGFKAKDALHTRLGVFWLDEKGVSLERRRLVEGSFSVLAANQRYVYAFGREGVRLPDQARIPLPAPARAALVLDDLYILSETGIHRLTPEGLQLGFRPGLFSGLQSDGSRIYTLESGNLVGFSLDLRDMRPL